MELFKNDLFFDIAKHSNLIASELAKGIEKQGYKFLTDSSTNQIFPIFPNSVIEKLSQKYDFYIWSKTDKNNSAIRLVASWATKREVIDNFLMNLREIV